MNTIRTMLVIFGIISIYHTSTAQTNNSKGEIAGQIYYLKKSIHYSYDHRNFRQAIDLINKVLSIDSTHEHEYKYLQGTLYNRLNDTVQALSTFQSGIKKIPDFPYNYSGIGFVLLKQKKKECLTFFLKAEEKLASYKIPIKTDQDKLNSIFMQDSANIHYGTGCAYMLHEKYEIAYQYFNRAFKLTSSDLCLAKMAECKYLLFDLNKALKLADQTLELEKKNTLAIYLKAETLWYYGKKEKALNTYDQIINYSEIFLKPQRSILPMKADTVLDYYNNNLKKFKAYLYAQRGFFKIKMQDSISANNDFEKSFENDSTNAILFNNRAIYHARYSEDTNLIFSEINKGIKLDSNKSNTIYYNRAIFYFKLKQYEKSLMDCKKALQNDSVGLDSYKPFTLLSELYFQLKNSTLALETANKAIEKGAIFPWPYVVRAKIRLELGEKEKGISDLKSANKFNYSGEFTSAIKALVKEYNIDLKQ